jgi:SNF2 family DNA or RNA helicase
MPQLDFSRCRLVRLFDGTMSGVKDHVKIGVEALVANPFFFIADEMGAMKSAQSIIAAQMLFEQNIIDNVIVIAPASVRGVWFDPELGELAKHLWFDLPASITEYHSKTRVWNWQLKGPRKLGWTITNYEFIRSKPRLKELLRLANPRTLLILDESAAIKTHNAAQTEACIELRWYCGRIVLLNGTPITGSVQDMFSQGNIMHPKILQCKYITHYRAKYLIMEPVLGAGGRQLTDPRGKGIEKVVGPKNLEELQARFKPYILRRLTSECLDLPPVLPTVTYQVPLDRETWTIYQDMKKEMVAWLSNDRLATATTAATKVMRLSQITSGFVGGIEEEIGRPALFDDEEAPEWMIKESADLGPTLAPRKTREIGRSKLNFVMKRWAEMLEQDSNLKLIVWCRFRIELERMMEEAARLFPDVARGYIMGGQKPAERAEALRLLDPRTAPEGPVFFGGTYGTGALGINLTASHTVINMSFDFSYWKFVQTAARVNRPGQVHPVSYFDVVATGPTGQKTIDHLIVRAREAKEDVANWTTSAWLSALTEA